MGHGQVARLVAQGVLCMCEQNLDRLPLPITLDHKRDTLQVVLRNTSFYLFFIRVVLLFNIFLAKLG